MIVCVCCCYFCLDLGVFSSESLVKTNPKHKVEIRVQRLQAPNENRDKKGQTVWHCLSRRSTGTTVAEYAVYQMDIFKEMQKVMILFLFTVMGK